MSERNGDQPSGWVKTTLSEVTSVSRAKAEPDNFSDVPHIGLEHIEGGSNRILSIGTVEDVKSTKSVFQRGDVLYGKLRPYLKKVCRPDFDGVCSTDILVFPESPSLDNGYLLYFLSQQSTADYATQNSNGINLPRISSSVLGEIEFPLPPLAEQRRIVAQIEALQERSRRAREALAEVGPLLEQFRQSVLAAAFRGDLTADWRAAHPHVEPASALLQRIRVERRHRWEQAELAKYAAKGQKPPKNWQEKYQEPEPVDDSDMPALPEGWCWASVEAISLFVTDGDHNPPKRVESGIPHLTAKNIKNWSINFDNCSYLTPEGFEQTRKRYEPRPGDLIVTCVGTLGQTAIVPKDCVFSADRNLAAIRVVPNGINVETLMYSLNTVRAQLHMGAISGSTAQPHVYLSDLRALCIQIPPLAEQYEINCRIRRVVALIDEIERLSRESLSHNEDLNQAILAKAFRGELVPQDPNDEPASILLERIRAQRAQQAEAAKGQKKTATTQRGNKMEKKSSSLVSQRRPLAEVLIDKGQAMAPEQLLAEAGYDDASIEEFYLALREEIARGRIREDRPSEKDVMLEAVKP